MEQIQKFPIAVNTYIATYTEIAPETENKVRIMNQMKDSLQPSYLLEVAHLIGGVNKVSSFSKKGMYSSGNDHSFNFSLFARGTRVHPITRTLSYWKRLTC